MLSTEVSSAICVQRFDDSRNSAIHTTYRISLRSSSMRKPRYPLLRVVICFGAALFRAGPLWLQSVVCLGCELDRGWPGRTPLRMKGADSAGPPPSDPWAEGCFPALGQSLVGACTEGTYGWFRCVVVDRFNDPSAGSPTER